MADRFMQIVLTPAVQAAQDHYFGRHQAIESAPERNPLTEKEATFIAARDSFYLATTNADGWPYIQHRGGPAGFLRVLGPNLLGFPDYKGNRQLLSTGNLSGNDKVAFFLMDYPEKQRLKILGHARVLDAKEHPELFDQLGVQDAGPTVERFFLIEVVSFDWNCSQYITPRYTAQEIKAILAQPGAIQPDLP